MYTVNITLLKQYNVSRCITIKEKGKGKVLCWGQQNIWTSSRQSEIWEIICQPFNRAILYFYFMGRGEDLHLGSKCSGKCVGCYAFWVSELYIVQTVYNISLPQAQMSWPSLQTSYYPFHLNKTNPEWGWWKGCLLPFLRCFFPLLTLSSLRYLKPISRAGGHQLIFWLFGPQNAFCFCYLFATVFPNYLS